MGALKRLDARHRRLAFLQLRVNAQRRVLRDALRMLERKDARVKMRNANQPMNGTGAETKTKKKGRPERWPGKCNYCCRKHLGLPGGHGHTKHLCKITQVWIKAGKCKL